MAPRKPSVFFAIPCGDFYRMQATIIEEVAEATQIDAIIAEDDVHTKGLWAKITDGIVSADRFMADVSSGSPNILLELGYAIDRKGEGDVGIFISNAVEEPSDLRGFVLQKYSSLNDFQNRLITWLSQTFPNLEPPNIDRPICDDISFQDDFLDLDGFHRSWSVPPGAAYHHSHEGLHFSNAHFPLLTTQLTLLHDSEFKFTARIDRRQIGWAVRGTRHRGKLLPSFCVMFTLDEEGLLTPHIFSEQMLGSSELGHYHRFDAERMIIDLNRDEDGWFEITTRTEGSMIEVSHDGSVVFTADLSAAPYAEVYSSFTAHDGQVGFRCHPDEEATVRQVVVRLLR